MKTLHLTLKKKWFDMIASGEKKEEYRYLRHYFCRRFLVDFEEPKQKYGCIDTDIVKSYEFKTWDAITFINGYRGNSPRITVKFDGIEIRDGLPEWGAISGEQYFVIKLGQRLTEI